MDRREFLVATGSAAAALAMGTRTEAEASEPRPNLVLVLCDQLRASALPLYGNPDCRTPGINLLADRGAVVETAISPTPICTPARAALMTGLHPTTLGCIANNKYRLPAYIYTLGDAFDRAGYATGYIGKWHLARHGYYPESEAERMGYVPPGPDRQGWQYWAAKATCGDYWNAFYWRDDPEPVQVEGYEPYHQTELAVQFLRAHQAEPFALAVSYGPPHPPSGTHVLEGVAPDEWQVYDSGVSVPPNVPADRDAKATRRLAGYYALTSSVDWCLGRLMTELHNLGLADNTVVAFTSDHGAMVQSYGAIEKQQPYDEAARVPFVVAGPGVPAGTRADTMLSLEDVMPTLLGLCGGWYPPWLDGIDLSQRIRTGEGPGRDVVHMICDARGLKLCGRFWEAVRTEGHLYARDYLTSEPWLVFDYHADPYGLDNLAGKLRYNPLRQWMESLLTDR